MLTYHSIDGLEGKVSNSLLNCYAREYDNYTLASIIAGFLRLYGLRHDGISMSMEIVNNIGDDTQSLIDKNILVWNLYILAKEFIDDGAYENSLDFLKSDAASTINKWISDATKKKIDKMVDSPISPDVVMYLINAIYFKGDWAVKFDAKDTVSAPFYSSDGSLDNAMMMKRAGKAEYGQGGDYKAVRLPYGKGKMSMYCILPDENTSAGDFISSLDNEKWKTIKSSIAEKEEVQLLLPRFKMDYGIKNLNESLTALGMGEAFTDVADFSGIRDNICISRVLHKAVIEVNEEGSEAAAATVVEMRETAAAEPLSFVADRPFVFVIADDETGSILFMGKLSNVK
jgi:serpin B